VALGIRTSPAVGRSLILAALCAASSAGCRRADSSVRPPGSRARPAVAMQSGVVYGQAPVRAAQPANKNLELDLYEPQGLPPDARRPALVAIHGGGFVDGDKGDDRWRMPSLCRELASRGFVCAAINYRLRGDDPPGAASTPAERALAAAVDDAASAVSWLAANAATHHVDSSRIAVGGGSAGAVTALHLAYVQKGRDLPIRAVVDLWGSLGKNLASLETGMPPLLVIHGTRDESVAFSQAQALADRARQVGVPCVLVAVDGAGHNMPLDSTAGGIVLYQRIADFLSEHLGSP
jgi:acetyl esterase/lipase